MNSACFVWGKKKKKKKHTQEDVDAPWEAALMVKFHPALFFFFFISQAFAGLSASVSAETNRTQRCTAAWKGWMTSTSPSQENRKSKDNSVVRRKGKNYKTKARESNGE